MVTEPTTAAARVQIRVSHSTDVFDYHEWVHVGERLKVDRLGRVNARMIFKNAALWICNNPDCYAQAIVPDAAIQALIKAEEDPLEKILSHR